MGSQIDMRIMRRMMEEKQYQYPQTPDHFQKLYSSFGCDQIRQNKWKRYNVKDFGAQSIEDGARMDQTEKFQLALNCAYKHGGGVVIAPAGTYTFAGWLVIPPHVTLEGEYVTQPNSPHRHMHYPDSCNKIQVTSNFYENGEASGTCFLVYNGENEEDGVPFITLVNNSTIKGIAFFYPNQRPLKEGTDNPLFIPFPWTIAVSGAKIDAYLTYTENTSHEDGFYKPLLKNEEFISNLGWSRGFNNSVIDVCLVNSWNGINLHSYFAGEFHLKGISGQPLNRGIVVNTSDTWSRIENVCFGNFWIEYIWIKPEQVVNNYSHVAEYMQNNAIGLTMKGFQGSVRNLFIWGYRTGVKFSGGYWGRTVPVSSGATFSNIHLDGSRVPIEVACTQGSVCTVYFTNMGIAAFDFFQEMDSMGLYVHPEAEGNITINNATFGFSGRSSIDWQGAGELQVSNCRFANWNANQNWNPAAGNIYVPAIDIKPIDKNTVKAIISGNIFQNVVHSISAIKIDKPASPCILTSNYCGYSGQGGNWRLQKIYARRKDVCVSNIADFDIS